LTSLIPWWAHAGGWTRLLSWWFGSNSW
jgi:hypothetical protein